MIYLTISINLKQGILEDHINIELEKYAKYFLLNKGLRVKYYNVERK